MSANRAGLEVAYQLRFATTREYRNDVWRILCSDFFQRYIPPTSTVLDLGAGWGEFINNIAAVKKYAMDLNSDARAHLNEDVGFIDQDCSTRWPMDDNTLDVVFTSNFLEHLPTKDKIEHTIAEVHRCLRENGAIICLGPNIKCIPGAYWDFWDHYVPLTEMSLRELLRTMGFEIDVCLPRFLPYSMSTGRTPPLMLVRIYLKCPWAWPVFGKQFLVVARKRKTAGGASGG